MAAVSMDWHKAEGLDAPTRALLAFGEKLARAPAAMAERDVRALREAGFDDEAILAAVQIVGLFSYFNRIANALGLEPEAAAHTEKA